MPEHRLALIRFEETFAFVVLFHLRRALTWFARRGVVVQRILTDNGSAYRSRLLATLCRTRRLGQRFTRL